MTIYFYRTTDEYGCFSNFSAHGFILKDVVWRTSEHYFQAQKFAGTEHETELRLEKSPMTAAMKGRSRKRPLRADWETVKDDIMREAVLAKFRQNPTIQAILLGTGEEELIEKTTKDHYWGCGTSGNGRNMLGKILMETRAILRAEQHEAPPISVPPQHEG